MISNLILAVPLFLFQVFLTMIGFGIIHGEFVAVPAMGFGASIAVTFGLHLINPNRLTMYSFVGDR
jgi:hypothetical protein